MLACLANLLKAKASFDLVRFCSAKSLNSLSIESISSCCTPRKGITFDSGSGLSAEVPDVL